MSIVAFHAGGLTPGDSLATALARALDITAGELKNAMSPNNHNGPDFWPLILEKLNDLSTARGGRPVTENGALIIERSRQDDCRRNGLDVFDELYGELPESMKDRLTWPITYYEEMAR
jgi:hypothetical protein